MNSVLLLGAMLCASAQGAVIVSNFGPGDSYQTGTSNSWAVGNGANNNGLGSSNAVGFDYTGTETVALTQIRFAANWFEGENELLVSFLGGSDIETATVLESFTFAASNQFSDEIFEGNSVVQPLLNPGGRYWIVLTVADLQNTTWGWQWNDVGQVGYRDRFNDGPWGFALGATPVYEVRAEPLPQVPEPGTLALAGAGLVAAGLLRRRAQSRHSTH